MYKIKQVVNDITQSEFIQVPVTLYQNDPNWIRPLDQEIAAVFNPEKNKKLRKGKAARWILTDNDGNLYGRIAAFIDQKNAHTFDQPTGGVGFFECINSKQAAFLLLDTAKEWLNERGMEAMDGPINFGERNRFWGMLVEGFKDPSYGHNYNFPYYIELFESYGFQTYFEQFTYYRMLFDPMPERAEAKAKRILNNPDYHFTHLRKSHIDDVFIDDFLEIYNRAWVKHDNFKAMSREQALAVIKKMKPIMQEELIWFAYYKDQPVGFFIMAPELGPVMKKLNGKLNLLGKLKFLWHKHFSQSRKIQGIMFGIVPEHQGKGLESALIKTAAGYLQHQNKYDSIEMSWIGDFNPKMNAIVQKLGAKIAKRHITYRMLFDPTAEFKRAPIIG